MSPSSREGAPGGSATATSLSGHQAPSPGPGAEFGLILHTGGGSFYLRHEMACDFFFFKGVIYMKKKIFLASI